MSTPVARSEQFTHSTSARSRKYGRPPSSPVAAARSPGQCGRATTTGCPGRGPYRARAKPERDDRAASTTRRTTAAPMSGVSTGTSATNSAAPAAAALMPVRNDALNPSAQSGATTARAGGGTSTIAAPRTTMTSSHPASRSAATAARSQSPSPPSTFGMPYRVPAPAASTKPVTEAACGAASPA